MHKVYFKKDRHSKISSTSGVQTPSFGFPESWLKPSDDNKLWQISPTHFKTFRTDGEELIRENGGEIMLIVPECPNPKTRNDVNNLNKKLFESLWIECSLNNNISNKNKQLNNISYNPKKT